MQPIRHVVPPGAARRLALATLLITVPLLSACAGPMLGGRAPFSSIDASDPTGGPDAGPEQTAPADPDAWAWTVAPYIWGTGVKGDVATLPPGGPIGVDASFSDLLKDLDIALFVSGEARKGEWALFFDVVYTDLSLDDSTPGPLFDGLKYDLQLTVITLGPAYRVVAGDDGFLDAVAGMRMWSVDNELKLDGGLVSTKKIKEDKTWYDPMFGAKGQVNLGEGWTANGWALAAAGGDSDSAYDLFGGVTYAAGESGSVLLGYRKMKVDYSDDGFLFDATFEGPVAGYVFRF